MNIELHVQAIIFSAPNPVSLDDLKSVIEKSVDTSISIERIEESIENLRSKFATDSFAFELVKTGGGYQFLSKAGYYKTINTYLNLQAKKRLSKSALETLSVIAYHNNGITKAEIEQIRGVNTDYTVDKLLEKELIEIAGRKDGPGNPILYKTTAQFLDYIGINSLDELPKLHEIETSTVENEIGKPEEV